MASTLKYYTGSVWTAKPLKYWTGSAWTTKQLKYWNGSAWIGAAAATPPFLDSFDRANANLEASATASGGWTWTHDGTIAGAFSIVGNQARVNTTDATGSAYATPSLGTAEHYVQYKVINSAVSMGSLVACRMADRNNMVGIAHGTSVTRVYRRVAGVLTQLIQVAIADNDILRLECGGAYFTLKRNGTVVSQLPIGATFAATNAGMLARGVNAVLYDDFEAGLLTSRADTFDRANANLEASATASGGWSWTHDGVIAAGFTIVSNALKSNTALTTGSSYKTPALSSADQYVSYKVTDITSATGPFACCRLADASNFIGIRTGNGGSNGQIEVYRRVSGTLSSLYTSAAVAVAIGDIIRLEVSGSNFRVYKNGILVAGPTAIGATLTATTAGLVARSSTTMTFEDFEAG